MKTFAAPSVPSLRGRATTILGVLALLATLTTSFALVAPTPASAQNDPQPNLLSEFDQGLFEIINENRRRLGLEEFIEYVPMSDASLDWSTGLADRPLKPQSCKPEGELNSTQEEALLGAPIGVPFVLEVVAASCGITGVVGTIDSEIPGLYPQCDEERDQTKPVDQFCRYVQDPEVREALEGTDYGFIGLGTLRKVSGGFLGEDVRAVTTIRLAAGHPCFGLEITIDMNTNGGNGEGTPGNDVILGTPFSDVINAGDGDDVICGGFGNDVIEAGSGDDRILAGPGNDKVFGRRGNDRIDGGDGDDVIHGNKGEDDLRGSTGDDKIFGYADNDKITGGPGDDRLHGNFGDDVIEGGDGDDAIFGYGDNDTLSGGAGKDLLTGNFGDDAIDGGLDDDRMFGADGDDVLRGGEGNDVIAGNSLNDTIDGGQGDDTIDGGIGNDSCDGSSGTDTAIRCETIISVP